MLNPNDERVKKSLPAIEKALRDRGIQIYFEPSQLLRNMIIAGTHPMLKDLCKDFAAILISEKGIRIQKMMVYNWLKGDLDEKNSFILSNGEVKIIGSEKQVKEAIERKISEDKKWIV